MDNNRWKQAPLPVKYGGLGIRSIRDVSTAAFLSSLFKAEELINLCFPYVFMQQFKLIGAFKEFNEIINEKFEKNSANSSIYGYGFSFLGPKAWTLKYVLFLFHE